MAAVSRYLRIIESIARGVVPFSGVVETETLIQVERGIVLPLVLAGRLAEAEAAVELLVRSPGRLLFDDVIDAGGHRRGVYRQLLVYAWLSAAHGLGNSHSLVRHWRDAMAKVVSKIATELSGSDPALSAWKFLILHVALEILENHAWRQTACEGFRDISARQQADGDLWPISPGENPETHWYSQLVLLHAMAAYAAWANDEVVGAAVARNAAYHQKHTQADHATSQPWGLLAFLGSPETMPMADQILHAAGTQAAGGQVAGVSLILLADALYCAKLAGRK